MLFAAGWDELNRLVNEAVPVGVSILSMYNQAYIS